MFIEKCNVNKDDSNISLVLATDVSPKEKSHTTDKLVMDEILGSVYNEAMLQFINIENENSLSKFFFFFIFL